MIRRGGLWVFLVLAQSVVLGCLLLPLARGVNARVRQTAACCKRENFKRSLSWLLPT